MDISALARTAEAKRAIATTTAAEIGAGILEVLLEVPIIALGRKYEEIHTFVEAVHLALASNVVLLSLCPCPQ